MITCKLTREQNKLVRKLLESETAAYKNWIVSALEDNEILRAKALVVDLKKHQELFQTFVPDEMVEEEQIYPRYCR